MGDEVGADGFVYAHGSDDGGQFPDFAVPYRIIKRTKTRIYVNQDNGREHAEPRHCFTLDRIAFERDGKVWCPSRVETYYATEAQALSQDR
jgi:hypothetical protein